MSSTTIRRTATSMALITALGACGSATTLGSTMLTGLFSGAAANGTATVDAEIRANDVEQQLLHVVTDEGRRGFVRWDVATQVARGDEITGAVTLKEGDRVQLRLRKTSEVDIYTDYVLLRERAPGSAAAAAPPDTALTHLEGRVARRDAEKGQFELVLAGDSTILVTLPYNPPQDVIDRFGLLKDGDRVRLSGRYIAERRLELDRFH